MAKRFDTTGVRTLLLLGLLCLLPSAVLAQSQGRGRAAGGGEAGLSAQAEFAGVTLSVDLRTRILDYYAAVAPRNVDGLPPGIRRNLARGKPLPPGLARRSPPAELTSHLRLHDGFELVEVGLDVFLVEVATNVIHDVLMDVIR